VTQLKVSETGLIPGSLMQNTVCLIMHNTTSQ
jgi:hypothetical protein